MSSYSSEMNQWIVFGIWWLQSFAVVTIFVASKSALIIESRLQPILNSRLLSFVQLWWWCFDLQWTPIVHTSLQLIPALFSTVFHQSLLSLSTKQPPSSTPESLQAASIIHVESRRDNTFSHSSFNSAFNGTVCRSFICDSYASCTFKLTELEIWPTGTIVQNEKLW